MSHIHNCSILERTADGVSVGRCWFHSPDDICPRHGDVSEALKLYRETGVLTDENNHKRTWPEAPQKPQKDTWVDKLKKQFAKLLY